MLTNHRRRQQLQFYLKQQYVIMGELKVSNKVQKNLSHLVANLLP